MLDFFFYFNLICSIGGIVFFIISLFIIRRIMKLFPASNIAKKWIVIEILIFIFLGGYVVNIIFLALDMTSIVALFTAIVYIFGALFVFFIVSLSYNTYKTIILSQE